MVFKFRVRKDNQDHWVESQGETFIDALQDWHLEHCWSSNVEYDLLPRGLGSEIWYFLIAWDEEGERWISRVIKSPIRRKGGIKRRTSLQYPTLAELAEKAGLPSDAFDGPWEGESMEWH